jgi:co-chaperonin GroES (HSP10)
MKIIPLNDWLLIRLDSVPTGLGYLGAAVFACDTGTVVAMGAICGVSEAQGVKVGTRVMFDRGCSKQASREDLELVLVCEDNVWAQLVEDDPDGN